MDLIVFLKTLDNESSVGADRRVRPLRNPINIESTRYPKLIHRQRLPAANAAHG